MLLSSLALLILSQEVCLRAAHLLVIIKVCAIFSIFLLSLLSLWLAPYSLCCLPPPWPFYYVPISFRLPDSITTLVDMAWKFHKNSGVATILDTVPINNLSLVILSMRWSTFSPSVVGAPSASIVTNNYFSVVIWSLIPSITLSLFYLRRGVLYWPPGSSDTSGLLKFLSFGLVYGPMSIG